MRDEIKLVAVDMDGTFLNKKHDYDRARFAAIYERMKAVGVHFVVASGNQYYQLKSFFEPFAEALAYVSENGSYVVDGGEVLYSAQLPEEKIAKALEILEAHPEFMTIISCEQQAYMLDSSPEFFVNIMRMYYHRLKLVSSFKEIADDPYLKISIGVPEAETMQWVDVFKEAMAGTLEVTSSGHGCIDLVGAGIHKANALKILMDRWQIAPESCMASGDGYNDLEMLKLCKYGYCMGNAPDDMKEQFEYHAPGHDEDGVLEVLDQWF